MNQVMLKLGELKFEIATATYATLQRQWRFNWSSKNRLLNTPVWHFSGQGVQSISLEGTTYPGSAGVLSFFNNITTTAQAGKPLLMVSGTGEILGYWLIKEVTQKDSVFAAGGLPRKVKFTLKLNYYGENSNAL